ncbi:MAG: acyltransferase family protein [Crenarchaeota archaeon]|nr:acyltransferase family protein [Thermoproteota archaeon]
MIRVVAITLVILLHAANEYYTVMDTTPLESTSFWWVSCIYKTIALPCVPLFVMLSGTLLLKPHKVKEPIRVFLKKRLNRIGLAFIFWSIIYLAWSFYVTRIPVTLNNIFQGAVMGLFTGPYYHFWYLYLIAGLYLMTPVLRTLVAHENLKITKYFILIWFIGVGIIPLIELTTGFNLNDSLFAVGGWMGYYVIGLHFQRYNIRKPIVLGFLSLGFVWTILSTCLMNFTFYPSGRDYFFFDSLSANVIIYSVALFLLLNKAPTNWANRNRHPHLSYIARAISKNTLPIYLFHLIILETLQRGYLGLQISITTINPVIAIPLVTAVTLFITLGLVLIMKKVPILKRLIG